MRAYRQLMPPTPRAGFTLIEVIIAVVVLTVGALALAASSALTARRMSENGRRLTASAIARNRAESAHAYSCTLPGGIDQWLSVRSEWWVNAGTYSADIKQKVSYPTRTGTHGDDFLTAVPCL